MVVNKVFFFFTSKNPFMCVKYGKKQRSYLCFLSSPDILYPEEYQGYISGTEENVKSLAFIS